MRSEKRPPVGAILSRPSGLYGAAWGLVSPQSGQTEQQPAYEFRLASHAGLTVDALQASARGIDRNTHRRRRLLHRLALQQQGSQARLARGESVQFAQVLLVAVERISGSVTKIAAIRPRSPSVSISMFSGTTAKLSGCAPEGLVIESVPPALERCLPVRPNALFSSRSSRAVSSARSARRMLPRAVKPSPAIRISSACRFAAKRLRCSSTNTHAPGQLVERAQCGVSLDLEIRQAAPHHQRALQMRQQHATTFNLVVIECARLARAQHFEKHGGRLFPRQHRAQPVMQILRL